MECVVENRGRVQVIDIAKGLGILLVVLGHSMPVNSFPLRVIYSFHMPLFFLLSGLCYNDSKYIFTTLLRVRTKQLFVPLLLFSMILRLLQIVVLGYPLQFSIWGLFPFSMWFVFILFLTELCGYFVVKLPLLVAFALGLISMVLYYTQLNLPYSLSCLPSAIMFYVIGYKLRNIKKETVFGKFNIFFGGGILLFVVIYAYSNSVYLDMCHNVLPAISIVVAIAGIWLVLGLSRILETISFSNILVFLGKNTFVIMAVHQFFMYIATIYIKPHLGNDFIYMAVFKIVQQIIMWSGILLSIWLVNNKVKWLIGKS